MKETRFRLLDVRKVYGSRQVLEIPHLDIYTGETFGVVGPNGAGKSTLLRLLNFLEPCTSGEIWLEGELQRYPIPIECRRRITMVFQNPVLLDRSVWSNVTYGLRIRGRGRPSGLEGLLQRLDLELLASAPARTLSGGEMQRVALARALALEPKILLLDEPTANLDPYNTALIEAIIRDIRHHNRMTVVLVTHNVFQARRLADRVGLLIGGSMVEVAETDQFFEQPKDPRVGAFVRGEVVG